MTLLRRLFGGPVLPLLLVGLALSVLQLLLPWPVLLAYGLLLTAAIVLVADPVRVAALTVVFLVLGAVTSAVDPTPVPGFWQRYPWMLALGVLAVVLARVERDRVARVRRSASLLGEVVDATDQPVFAKRFGATPGEASTFVLTNAAWRAAVGAPDPAPEVLRDVDVFGPETAAAVAADEQAAVASGAPVTFEQALELRDGERRTYLTTLFPLRDDGVVTGVGGIATDVTDRKRQEQRLAAVFAHSPVPTLRLVTGGRRHTVVLDANDAVRDLLGLDVVGATTPQIAALVHPDDLADLWQLFDRAVAAAREDADEERAALLGRETRLLDADGSPRWVILSVSAVGRPEPDGEQEVIVQFEDITARKQAETALTEKALSDPVTGLPNRYALSDRLATALPRLARRPGLVCVMFCDLDRFKQVNDVFGHAAGDELLREAARRLSGALRPEDTVGRHGGDEFVVVCEGVAEPREAVLLATRLQDRLRERWSVGGHDFTPTTSIGIAFTDDPSCDPGDLLRQADVAMYRAKDSGRDRIELYDLSLDDELAAALAMQQQLRSALADDALVVHYQPVVRLDDLSHAGAEGLVRMRSDDRNLLLPGAFLGHAEAGGLIHDLGHRVVDTALRDLAAWRAAGLALDVGFNVSPTQLARPDLVRHLLDGMHRHGVDPTWVVVEVTETALVHESSVVSATLQRLHSAGVHIALDDFGTGYSSLSWLHQFPVDIVKIDKSFVQTMADDQRRAVLVRAVLDIAAETGLRVVGEGVETQRQAAMLRDFGCEWGQGWLFGRPVPVDDPSWAQYLTAARA